MLEHKVNAQYNPDKKEDDLKSLGESPEEKAANAFAADSLIPDEKWKTVPKVYPSSSAIQKLCNAWANDNGYNKWIVLGRIGHDTGMYKFKNDTSRKIS